MEDSGALAQLIDGIVVHKDRLIVRLKSDSADEAPDGSIRSRPLGKSPRPERLAISRSRTGRGGRIRTSKWRFRNRMLLPVREELQNPHFVEFINISKRSNFENRTEFAESRALERNEPLGEE